MSTVPSSPTGKTPPLAPAKKKKKKRSSFLKKILLGFLMLGLIAGAAVSVGLAWYINKISVTLPSDEEILSYQANEASVVYDRKNRVVAELYTENRKPIKFADVSKWMVMSILAAEDSEFYSHMGIRPLAIVRSLLTGEGGQGASTITQQLARNLFLTREKSLERKAKEALISLRMEKLYSKDKLMETYLNAIYFGHGAWGIDAAAHNYYNKSAKDLTLGESSILAGLVAAPEKYSPLRHLESARARQNYVLGRMVRLGWATPEEAKAAAAEELKFNEHVEDTKQSLGKAPYFVSQVLFKELIPEFGSDRVYKGGMKIYTTLDLDVQASADAAMSNLKSEGALVSLDPATGAVLALVGGKNFEQTKFNRATQAHRQSGSMFKPIVYTTAIEAGYRPIDHILDRPISLYIPNSKEPVWSPKNFGDKYNGEVTLLYALVHSQNTPVVRLTCMLGAEQVVETARRMGITSQHLEATLSVGLGVTAVTPLEMSVVYSVFANDGARVTPYFIREIRNKDNKVIFSALPKQEAAIEPSTAQIVRSMLKEVVRAGTGAAAKIPGYEVFGKTGTTNDSNDAWFAGGVPGLVTVVYAGNDDLKPLGKNATGGRIALPIWTAFMKEAVKILDVPQMFPAPSPQVQDMRVCIASGYPASPACPKTTDVLMPVDKIPTTPCPTHGASGYGNGGTDTYTDGGGTSYANGGAHGYSDEGGTGYSNGNGADEARNAGDPNVPKLLLLTQDKDEMEAENALEPELPLDPDTAPVIDPVPESMPLIDPTPPTPLPSPPASTERRRSRTRRRQEPQQEPEVQQNKSWREYIKRDDRPVETRYQELLKKYNIQ